MSIWLEDRSGETPVNKIKGESTIMNTVKLSKSIILAGLAILVMASTAQARVVVGVGIGIPLGGVYAPYPYYGYGGYPYPYAYPYAPPAYAPAPVIIQQQAAPEYQPQAPATQAPANTNWYYCEKSKSYYPYVQACAGGWKLVPSTPPGAQ